MNIKLGEILPLSVAFFGDDGHAGPVPQPIELDSSDPDVGPISWNQAGQYGSVKGLAQGTTTITMKAGKYTDSLVVNVGGAVKIITGTPHT